MTAALSGIGTPFAASAPSTATAGDAAQAIDFAAMLFAFNAAPNELPPEVVDVSRPQHSAEATVEEDEPSAVAAGVPPPLDALPLLDASQPLTPLPVPQLPATAAAQPLPQPTLPSSSRQSSPPPVQRSPSLPQQAAATAALQPPALPSVPAAAPRAAVAATASTSAPPLPRSLDGGTAAEPSIVDTPAALDACSVQQPLAATRSVEPSRAAAAPETPASRGVPDAGALLLPDTNAIGPAAASASALLASDTAVPAHSSAPQAELQAAVMQPVVAPMLSQGAAAAAPAATLLAIATPLVDPDFASVLSTQVSVLARDGVQHAELRLNPPEMGPIDVRIELADGAHATVHFAVDVATTRAVLEAGLPELAGALREAGLTLVGGGVSDAVGATAAARRPRRAARSSPRCRR